MITRTTIITTATTKIIITGRGIITTTPTTCTAICMPSMTRQNCKS